MNYPPIRQLGFGAQPNREQRSREDQHARRITLDVRRHEERERHGHPAPSRSNRPARDDRHSRVARRYTAAVAAIVLAVVIVYAVVASPGVS